MWLLNFLPDWFFYGTLALSIAGFAATYVMSILKFIPFIYTYKKIVQFASVAIMAISLFMLGANYNNNVWEERVKEMEAKVAAAEAQSAEENVKIVTKVKYKKKIIHERGQEIIKYIDREIVKYDVKFAPGGICEIPKEFIESLNKAAE